jgi:hypothetical protein
VFALVRTLADRIGALAEALLCNVDELDPQARAGLLEMVVELQAVYVDGRTILRVIDTAGEDADGPSKPNRSDELSVLIVRQVERLRRLRSLLTQQHRLLTSVSATSFTRLAPLIDEKSGLLTRWLQQAQQSLTSSSTVFFLPRTVVDAAVATIPSADGSDPHWDRDAYLKLTTKAFRELRRSELRDIGMIANPRPERTARIRVDTAAARTELEAIRRQVDALAGLTRFSVASATGVGYQQPRLDRREFEIPETLTLLFLAANPSGTSALALEDEKRQIQARLWKTPSRDNVTVESTFGLLREELIEQIQRFRPTVVHFSGHGDPSGNLILETQKRTPAPAAPESVVEVFRILGGGRLGVRCVVLNACFTEPLARALAQHVECVIGMGRAISDQAAIVFASQLYSSLGYGSSVKEAFELARAQLALDGIP